MIGLLDLRRRIESGALRPGDALAAARERIVAEDAALASFVALADLPAAAPSPERPLAGIAVGIKDIVDTADLPTEMGLPAVWGGWRPRADAAVVAQVARAGGWIAGKTATTALAHLDPAATRNPHDPARTPGGSSSGSAAAVAAGLVPLAVGTQTGGSVIRPAAFCGVAAVKPSFRLLPTVGVKAQAWTLDTLGLFAATVPDVAAALEAVSGRSLLPAGDPGTLRVGLVLPDPQAPPEPDMADALERAARALERDGARIVRVALPPDVAAAIPASLTIQGYESRIALAWELDTHRDRLPPQIAAHLDAGDRIPAEVYDAARGTARRARTAMREVFALHGVDVLLTPSAPGAAPLRDTTGDPRFNRLWTLLGLPCVNVPGLSDPAGLPLGLQVVAPFARDGQALAAAARLERVLRRLD